MVDENVIVQIFLVAISATTAFIIWRKMGESNRITRESNNELKKSNDLMMLELKQKFEPQFSFKNSTIQYETDKITANFTCKITNKGTTSLYNLTLYDYVFSKNFDMDELFDKEEEIKNEFLREIISLPPNGEIYDLKVTFKEANHEILKIILWFEFDNMGEKQELIFVQHFKNLSVKGYDVIPNSQIQLQRKNS